MAALKPIRWWQRLPLPWRPWRIVGHVPAGDEVPDRLPRRGVVLVEPGEGPTWAAFDCPCRTGHRLMVNLDTRRRPAWHIDSPRPLTIRPSIDDITAERRCHFVIRRGKIEWARNEQRSAL